MASSSNTQREKKDADQDKYPTKFKAFIGRKQEAMLRNLQALMRKRETQQREEEALRIERETQQRERETQQTEEEALWIEERALMMKLESQRRELESQRREEEALRIERETQQREEEALRIDGDTQRWGLKGITWDGDTQRREKRRQDKLKAERLMYGSAYQEALKAGKARSTRIPVMIVGKERSGKTSLKKHLLGMTYDSEQPSTDGIEVDVVEITDENTKVVWKRKNVKCLGMSADEANEKLLKQVAQVADKPWQEPHQYNLLKQQQQQQQQTQAHRELTEYDLHNIRYFQKISEKKNTVSPLRVFLHDFAGQDIFYDTHFYFLRLHSVYIVVHDLTSPLEDVAQPRFMPSRINVERNLKNPLQTTNLQRFLSWLTVLQRLRDTDADAVLEDLEGCKVPPALIALTNSDRFNGNVEEVTNIIRHILVNKGYSNVFLDFYVMDNTSSGKGIDQAGELRDKVYKLCKEMLDKQRPVPIRWLQFEAKLTDKLVEEKTNFISIDKAWEIGKVCNVESIDDAIKFLHRKGVIVYHPGSSVVVLNPPWLMNILTNVITVPQDAPKHGPQRKLITEGILMQDYLEGKEHGEIVKELLIKFGLICRWEHADGPAFIVPSVAPLMEDGEGLEAELSTSPVIPVFFDFKLGYLLPGLFTKFVVRMINECRECLRIQQPRLFCNYTLLSFKYKDSKFDVYIIKQLARIKIGVVPWDSASEEHCSVFISYLKEMIIKSMQGIKDDDELFYRNVDICLAVKCSECFGEHNPCLDHGDVDCKEDHCGHYWLLEKLQKCSDDPACRHSSVLRTREFSLERAKPWIFAEDEKRLKEEVPSSAVESQTVESPPQEVTAKEEVSNSAVESKAIEYLSQKLAAEVDGVSLSSPDDSKVTESSFHDVPISADLQPREIAMIAKRIPRNWNEVAFLTNRFEIHEIEDILCSRSDEDASSKARTMLTRYVERQGSRETLARALDEINEKLAREVRSGHYR